MATTKQKPAARRNIRKAQKTQSRRSHGTRTPRRSRTLSTAEKNRLADSKFAFPKKRKESLIDASHVRNAVARLDQVEGVTDANVIKRGAGSAPRHGSSASRSTRAAGVSYSPTATRRSARRSAPLASYLRTVRCADRG